MLSINSVNTQMRNLSRLTTYTQTVYSSLTIDQYYTRLTTHTQMSMYSNMSSYAH